MHPRYSWALCRQTDLRHETSLKLFGQYLPQVTLSALNEAGRAESTIPVLQQRSYTGRKLVITSALADARCIDLGMDRILEILNTTLRTSYTLDDHNSILRSVFQSFIARNYDFGILYANVRTYWYDLTLIKHVDELWMEDQKRRQDCLTNNGISLDFPCRRVWDLFANRVVPYWVTGCTFLMPISHAWMAPEDRVDLWTPINCYEWPVPIPKDMDLNLIRIEMLNQEWLIYSNSVEYVWLDVLCLRQEGGEREDLRAEEWKVDVPTIGSLYSPLVPFMPVVYYLSGLGRPLSLKPGELENERNWFNRAWTLQETASGPIIGGSTDVDLITNNDVKAKLKEKLQSVQSIREADVFYFLWQMQIRKSTKPLDKVAGLAYLLCGFLGSGSVPIYDETQSQEDAWDVLVDAMNPWHKLELLFIYPEPGNGPQRWRPSWKQVMERRIMCPDGYRPLSQHHRIWKLETGDFSYEGPCIESGFISGLAHGSYEEGKPRQGELVIKDGTRAAAPHVFNIFAHHAFPIPDGSYTLIGTKFFRERRGYLAFGIKYSDCWVVGSRVVEPRTWDMKFEKLSVINTVETKKLWQNYAEFGSVEPLGQVLLC